MTRLGIDFRLGSSIQLVVGSGQAGLTLAATGTRTTCIACAAESRWWCRVTDPKALREVLREARDAAAAGFRVAYQHGLVDELESELRLSGVTKGFGKRADDALRLMEDL